MRKLEGAIIEAAIIELVVAEGQEYCWAHVGAKCAGVSNNSIVIAACADVTANVERSAANAAAINAGERGRRIIPLDQKTLQNAGLNRITCAMLANRDTRMGRNISLP